jgi:hypothetical protein
VRADRNWLWFWIGLNVFTFVGRSSISWWTPRRFGQSVALAAVVARRGTA